MDRRALFFAAASVACALLVPVAARSQRIVPEALAVVYLVLALASWLDWLSERRTKV